MQHFTPLQYIYIALANSFGLDKLNWNDRLIWAHLNEDNFHSLIKEAEEPAIFFGALQALDAYKSGTPSGFPVRLDGTASGLQILAALTGDRKAAEICNLIDTDKREDAYDVIYKRMCEKIGSTGHVIRDDAKAAVMTSLYGSESIPKQIFGEGHLLQVFEETMNESAPFAWTLNKAFLALWDPTADKYTWTLPDNFHVQFKVMDTVTETCFFNNTNVEVTYKVNQPIDKGRSLCANTTHSVDALVIREMVRRCNYDVHRISYVQQCIDMIPVHQSQNEKEDISMTKKIWKHYQESGFLSARILNFINPTTIHMVDGDEIQELIDSLPSKPFQLLTVHDCMGALPAYCNDMRQQYNIILSQIAKSDMLSYLLAQIIGKRLVVKKNDPMLYKDILNANYAIT